MLPTIALMIAAMTFGGAMMGTGLLKRLLSATLQRIKKTGDLVLTTVGTCIGTNVLVADQFLSIIIPGQMFANAYQDQKLKPVNLSRTLEDSATLTSALIPWNTCGAYMTATLGVSTFLYAPFAFFNFICPIIAVFYGYTNIAVPKIED
jgi:NhaC family Na+:H+ antiporter